MLKVRDLSIDPPLVLAPMEGVTDLTFRRLIRSIGGCGLTVTEFIPGAALASQHRNGLIRRTSHRNGLIQGTGLVRRTSHRKVLRMAQFDPDERPISIQIYGRDPAILADAARYVQDLGADLVDLNMGCPSKKVCAHSGGSALLADPELATRIVRAIRAAVSIPFTVKMRSGWDPAHRNAPEIAAMCEGEGVEMLAVHWRTKSDLFGGVRDLSTVAEVVRRVRIPVLANGDIVDVPTALATRTETGAAGLMIGRGAIRDPWVFQRIARALRGSPPLVVDDEERQRVLLGYFATLRATTATEQGALGRTKQIAKYFCEGIPDGQTLRYAILHARTVAEAEEHVLRFFGERRRLSA